MAKPTPYVRPKDVKTLVACPACGSKALAPTQSRASRVADRVLNTAAMGVPLASGPNGKRCIDCGWQVA